MLFICLLTEKKKSTTCKLSVMFYLVDKSEDLSLGHDISDNTEKLFQEEEGQEGGVDGKPGYIGVFAKRPSGQNDKRSLLIKENQIFQVKELSAFLCIWEDLRVWAH